MFSVLAAAASYSFLLCGAGRQVGASWLDSWCSLCWQLLLLILYFSVLQVDRWALGGWTAAVLCAGSCCCLFFTSLWCRSTGGRQLARQLVFSVLAAAASHSLLLCGAGRPVGATLLDSWCSLCWQVLLLILYFSVVQVDRWALAGWTAGVLFAGSCCFLFFTSLWCRSTGGR